MNLSLKNLKSWHRWAAYGVFALFAFLLALRETFPAEAVKERFIMEAAAQGWQVSVVDIRPAGLFGVEMTGVLLESRDGLRLPIDRLGASLRLWPLLLGRQGVAFDARLFEGRIKGVAEEGKTRHRLAASISGVELSRAVPLRQATGLNLNGNLSGDIDLLLDDRNAANSEGHLDLSVASAALNAGPVPVPGMGALTLPRVELGEVVAKASVRDGKLTFDRLDANSQDLEASGEGLYCILQPRMAFARIFGKAHLRIHDALWAKRGATGYKGIVEMALAQARSQDGAYGFQIFGTLSQPQARMAP